MNEGVGEGGFGAAARTGRLIARPSEPVRAGGTGRRQLRLSPGRDGLLYVPAEYRADRPAPLVVALHGAGGEASQGLSLFAGGADEAGAILLAPDSRGPTWDLMRDGLGPDVAFLDRALGHVFGAYAVDAARVAIGGFSDGASYALSLGIANGDLFTHVVAFSPGFSAPPDRHGVPRFFVSHGIRDQVLPVTACSRRHVPRLRAAGYDVRYHEFDGGHVVPARVAAEAMAWFLGQDASAGRG